MLDFGKAAAALGELGQRFDQIVAQQKITNGLLALDTLMVGNISAEERETLEGIYANAFGPRAKVPFAPTGVDDAASAD